ncbi:30S ribosomal protein S4 [Candidatus Gottesmanbacteria bacterium RIFCSPLOWO2_01_FULL_49_10]|uniref:Small ribosomal subunit protein uS4 n=1 Tax=Candidatus Gottesmanbacteria bacterium RIFCSPLOWO2_01_FULL_49_10 TaxID=1798396 RepID=A0A1F6AY26_9BACT|nr:MAG: 30S ribosomal protein S4 [Microgenomates group bacterium GW2011_GWA2_47_8]OGG29402.1 MAG: 30S ribosomal protein S4 [Candidatus Gottesmanbacteria bacterium RIFCSPLOWO2_01_FULL_49_10]
MARYTGPTNRISRREGVDLGFKTVGTKAHAMLLKRLNVPPGAHGSKGRRKLSGFGEQLREKQKVKRMYGTLERQFRKVFERAKKWKGNTGEKLIVFLEQRLDNTLYRMALAPTRRAARQFVSHGHVFVNGKKVSIPSYLVRPEDVVSLKPKILEIPSVKKMLEGESGGIPGWLERKGPVGKVVRMPERTDVRDDINEQLIVEYYSR